MDELNTFCDELAMRSALKASITPDRQEPRGDVAQQRYVLRCRPRFPQRAAVCELRPPLAAYPQAVYFAHVMDLFL